jgi:predicted TIM-barrel fold metal-dependent hydrolase
MEQETKDTAGLTRRGFLAGSGAVLSAAVMGCQQAPEETRAEAAQAAGPSPALQSARQRVIDVHHHFFTPGAIRAAKEMQGNLPEWSPQITLDRMGRSSISTAILSISTPGVEVKNASETPGIARETNEGGMKLVADHPGRFGLFASLPLPNVDASLKEIEYAMDTLRADGICLMSHYADGIYLGDPMFEPVFAEMNRRNLVVFIHPHRQPYTMPAAARNTGIGELPFETTRATLSLLASGTPTKNPNIKFILPHAGGVISSLAARVGVLGSRSQGFATKGYDAVAQALSSFYFDVTNSVRRPPMRALAEMAPVSHILFGSDIPHGDGPDNDHGAFVDEALRELPNVGFTDADQVAILRTNAEELFPRLKQQTT